MKRLWLGVALVSIVVAAASADERAKREEFLRQAQVIGQQVIASGITLPQVVELELDGVRRRAVFKSFDITLKRQNVRVGNEEQRGLHDSWKFEVAAYELDKLLGLGLVPVTVARKLGGREGALIDWVEGVAPDYGAAVDRVDLDRYERDVARVWLFDYLAYNIDRTPDNLLLTEDFEVRLIDHSRASQRLLVPMRPLFRFPRTAIERLRALSADELRRSLGPYLNREELEALAERGRRVLARVDELLASRPEPDVLF